MIRGCFPPGAKLAAVMKKFRGKKVPPGFKEDLRGYIALCDSVISISVDDARVTLRSGLEDDDLGRSAGNAYCDVVQGSDVADFTTGHELEDSKGGTIKVCPARDD